MNINHSTTHKEFNVIDIDSLTLGQIKAIQAMLGAPSAAPTPHPFTGRYVICRCYSAGVHAGILVSQSGDEAVLRESRRLWSWEAVSGVALSGVAVYGLRSGRVDAPTDIALTGVIETIPCSAASEESIRVAR